jgi:hypothetical protein
MRSESLMSAHLGRSCGAKAGESRVVGDGDRSAAFSTTASTASASSEFSSTTSSEVTSIAAASSSATEASFTITAEATFTITTEASFAIATAAPTTATELPSLTATSTSTAATSTTASALRLLEGVVDVKSLLGLALAFTLGLGFLALEERSLLFLLEWLSLGPLLVVLLALVGSTCLFRTQAQICHALGFQLGEVFLVGLVVVFWFWLWFVEAIASNTIHRSSGVLESGVLVSCIPITSTFSTSAPAASFFGLCDGFTSGFIGKLGLTSIGTP